MKKLIALFLTSVICISSVSVFSEEYEGPMEHITGHNTGTEKIVSDIYEGGRREEQGEIFYVPGENTMSSEAKFLMDMGVIDHYHPDSALQRNALKKVVEMVYGSVDLFNEFFPDSSAEKEILSFDEALIVLMNMNGYSLIAEEKGHDIINYRMVAYRYGLLDGVDVSAGIEKLTAAQFVKMVYHAVTADLVKVYAFSPNTQYRIAKGSSLLTDYLRFTLTKGVVRANSYTSIIGIESAGEERLMIEDKVYSEDVPSDPDDFLGYYVTAWVDEENKIQSIFADERKNNFLEFGNDAEILESDSKESLIYYDNGRRKTVKIDEYADLIYNHVLCPNYTPDFYVIGNGTLRLIDHNADGKYDVVFRKEYTSFLPMSKSQDGKRVTDRNSDVYDISDVMEGKYLGIHAENGEEREFKDFTNTTGISVLTQKGSNRVTELIVLDKKTFEGTYQEKREDEDKYKIGDKKFRMAQVYKRSCDNMFPFILGSNVLVYLDMFDQIIFAESTTTAYKYAWFIDMSHDNVRFATIMKLFTQDNVISEYQLTDKISFNGQRCSSEALFNKPEIYESVSDMPVPQMIKYKINKDGYISGIQTADKTSNCGFGAKKSIGNDQFQMNLNFWDENRVLKYYGNDLSSFAGKYYVDPDRSVVFGIPTASALEHEDEDSAYRIITTFDANQTYPINLYDVDHEYRIGAAAVMVSERASQWVNKGYGSQLALTAGAEWDPLLEEAVGTLYSVVAGGSYTANLKDDPKGYYGNQLSQTHWDYSNLFQYAYPENRMLSNDPTRSVRSKVQEEYAKYVSIADVKPGTIFKYTSNNNYVAFFNIEFMVIPDMPIRDHFFEFSWNSSGDDATYSDMFDNSGNLIDNFVYDSYKTGWSKTKFWGSEIIAFGQVTEKFTDGFVFNAHVGDEDQTEWDRRIRALPTKEMQIFYQDDGVNELSTVAELQAGDYIFLNMIQGKLQGIVVYRDLPNV